MKKNKKTRASRIIVFSLIFIVGLIVVGSSLIGYYMSVEVTSLTSQEQTAKRESLNEDPWLQEIVASGRKVDDSIQSNGYMLPISYYYSAESQLSRDNNTVILVHGLGGNRHGLDAYVKYFLDLGFNALTYDQRASNDHPQNGNAYGILERLDLEAAVQHVHMHAPDKVLGLWGESFGGATVGLGLAMNSIDELVDFAILDSPMSEARSMIMAELDKMDVPLSGYFYRWASLMTKLRMGFWLGETDVTQHIGASKTPLLVIYSEADTVTPAWMAEGIYDAATATKERLVFEETAHVFSFYTYPEKYKAAVESFLGKIGVLG